MPNQTIFYGVLSDDERHLENARAICVAECSSLFREGILAAGREKITSTQWLITDDIRVACIMSANSFDGVSNNKLLENIKANFLAKFSGDLDVLNIAEFVEHEFSKKFKLEMKVNICFQHLMQILYCIHLILKQLLIHP